MTLSHESGVACTPFSLPGTYTLSSDCNLVLAGDFTVTGTFTFGDASMDSLILLGRVSTGTAAGTAIDIDSDYTYGQIWEIRNSVTSWTGVGSSWTGYYFRSEVGVDGSGKGLRNIESYAMALAGFDIDNLQSAYFEAGMKASGAVTIANANAVEAALAPYTGTGAITITNHWECLLCTPSGVSSRLDATNAAKIHGVYVMCRDGDGANTKLGSGIEFINDSGQAGTRTLTDGVKIGIGTTTGLNISGAATTSISITGASTTSIAISNTFSGNGIDFSGCTYVPTGSGGPCLIRAGTYDVPLTNASEDQSGLIRLYMETSADGSSYDRGLFVCLKTTGTKGLRPIAGLAEVHEDATGPASVHACEFISQLFDTGSNLAANGTMYAGWFKVTAKDGSTIDSTCKVAPLWLDNQLYGVNASNSEEYTIFSTTGGSRPTAWAGFETSSSGWKQLFYFDETMASAEPFVASGCSVTVADVPYLKVLIDTTQYGIPLIAI